MFLLCYILKSEEVMSTIELCELAHEAYTELKARYEGQTVTDLGVIISKVVRSVYDDRKRTIEEHVADYEKC